MKTLIFLVIITGAFLYCCQHNSLPEKLILSEDIAGQLKDKIPEKMPYSTIIQAIVQYVTQH